ncbi:peptide-methionine (S)-S-oxide reductase MsrA [Variovorax sp. RT4R15]|uniref:peptide-methionine (S)-S-oxide reductase MsrA n=1 Tax=Variovorax sp. RT4R15 TaxID=3443737 RepID=UPI003F4482CA
MSSRFHRTPRLDTRGRCALAGLALGVVLVLHPAAWAGPAHPVPPTAIDVTSAKNAGLETVVLAGGCFWGVQAVFQHVLGVSSAVSGYAGGTAETADYQKVESGKTGHAEAVRVTYDPKKINYGQLLQIYFSVAHDPTQINRQGPDYGPQYRSVIFATNAEQSRVASGYVEQLNRSNTFGKALATKVESGRVFYPAEAYHQDYVTLNPANPYVLIHELPKIENLKRKFPQLYQANPALVQPKKAA